MCFSRTARSTLPTPWAPGVDAIVFARDERRRRGGHVQLLDGLRLFGLRRVHSVAPRACVSCHVTVNLTAARVVPLVESLPRQHRIGSCPQPGSALPTGGPAPVRHLARAVTSMADDAAKKRPPPLDVARVSTLFNDIRKARTAACTTRARALHARDGAHKPRRRARRERNNCTRTLRACIRARAPAPLKYFFSRTASVSLRIMPRCVREPLCAPSPRSQNVVFSVYPDVYLKLRKARQTRRLRSAPQCVKCTRQLTVPHALRHCRRSVPTCTPWK